MITDPDKQKGRMNRVGAALHKTSGRPERELLREGDFAMGTIAAMDRGIKRFWIKRGYPSGTPTTRP